MSSADIAPLPFNLPTSSEGLGLIIVKGAPANTLSYTLSGSQTFIVQAMSIDVDTSASSDDSQVSAALFDQAGNLLANVRTASAIFAGDGGQCTLAPQLEDAASLPNPTSGVDIQGTLWATTVTPYSTISVTASDPDALVTQVRIWAAQVNDLDGDVGTLPPLYAHVPLLAGGGDG